MRCRSYRARVRRLLALAVAAFLLAGCEAPPFYGPSPTPTVAPVFDSEEEAFAAAEEILVRYLEASSVMGASGRDGSVGV